MLTIFIYLNLCQMEQKQIHSIWFNYMYPINIRVSDLSSKIDTFVMMQSDFDH